MIAVRARCVPRSARPTTPPARAPSASRTTLSGTITLTSGELLITNSVTINGPGASVVAVSGDGSSRVFEIEPGQNVTINGLTITDGSAPDQGGGILNDGSNLSLSGDAITDNVAFESARAALKAGALKASPDP